MVTAQLSSAEHLDAITRAATTRQAAVMLQRAMDVTGVSRPQLGRSLGLSKSRIARKCDPLDDASVTVRDMLHLRLVSPRLFLELLHALSELEASDGEPWRPQDLHLRNAMVALGQIGAVVGEASQVDRIGSTLRHQMDEAWADLEAIARQARRDLGRSSR